ncbi:MAG: GTP-binding protein [Cyanobacteria bacterium P01_F01_bin.53]
MRLPRGLPRLPITLLIAIAILISLGLLLSVVTSLGQLYSGLAVISPILAQAVTFLVVLALLGALGVVTYYASLFLRPKRKRVVTLPDTSDQVAAVSLQATQQQVAQVEDEITRQALAAKSQALAQRLDAQTFEIVVFGLGSAGKTALVNALLGEMAAPVAATLGTTTVAQTYRVALSPRERFANAAAQAMSAGGRQEVLITDTPGLLEAGEFGEAHAQEAKALATAADLLLFVIDNDLHRVEYEPLAMLSGMGKRSLLVFNKCDHYLPEEKEQILQRLRERTQGLLNPEDVVAIAAHPSPVTLTDGTQVQPEPDIAELVTRIMTVLRREGADLIADNLLLQSQQISQDAKALLSYQRRQQADAIVERYQWIGAGILAATPLPVVDMLATAAVNAQMVVELGHVYGVDVSIEEAKALAVSLAKTMAALSLAKGTMKLLAVGLQVNVATAVASKLLQGVSAAYLTRIAGKSFMTYFQRDQDWGDRGIQAVVEQQYQLNRRDDFVKQFLRSAVEKLT